MATTGAHSDSTRTRYSRTPALRAIFLVINFIYILLLEEQRLKARFGEEYIEYCRNVRRLLPRLRSWTPTQSGDTR